MHIKLVSFLRLIVNSCIAELDLFKLTCNTLIFFRSRDSGIVDAETAVDTCRMQAADAEASRPPRIERLKNLMFLP